MQRFDSMAMVFVVVILWRDAVVSGQFQSADIDLARLIPIWESMAEDVLTAKLVGRQLMVFSPRPDRALTRTQINDFVTHKIVQHIESENAVDLVSRETSAFIKQHNLINRQWWKLEIVEGPDSVRNFMDTVSARTGSRSRLDRVRSSDGEVDFDEQHKQASIMPSSSRAMMYTIGNIRYGPPKSFLAQLSKANEQLRITSSNNDSIELVLPNESLRVNARTGFVHHVVSLDRNGSVIQERLQFAPQEAFDGILIPRVSAHLKYYPGGSHAEPLLRVAYVFWIDEAKINEELAEDAFAVSVPKGTTIVTYGGSGDRADVVTANEPVEDLRTLLKSPAEASRRPYLWIVSLAVVVPMVIWIALFFRRMHKHE